jgi:hypothetical protein
MTALTKVREVVVQSVDELNEILVDMQIDEESNIIHVSKPTNTSHGMIFQILYHIKNMERELEKNEITSIE